jgi:hypothetical protein
MLQRDFCMPDDVQNKESVVKTVADEIAMLRRELQQASASLNRIEKRLRFNFPDYPKPPLKKSERASGEQAVSTKGRDELLRDFDTILEATKTNGDSGFRTAVTGLSDADAAALAYELGAVPSRKAGRKRAEEAIRRRAQESMLLQTRRDKSGAG